MFYFEGQELIGCGHIFTCPRLWWYSLNACFRTVSVLYRQFFQGSLRLNKQGVTPRLWLKTAKINGTQLRTSYGFNQSCVWQISVFTPEWRIDFLFSNFSCSMIFNFFIFYWSGVLTKWFDSSWWSLWRCPSSLTIPNFHHPPILNNKFPFFLGS